MIFDYQHLITSYNIQKNLSFQALPAEFFFHSPMPEKSRPWLEKDTAKDTQCSPLSVSGCRICFPPGR